MVMNREKLLKAYPSVPENVQQRMDETLLKLRIESANQRQISPKRKLSFVLAMVMAMVVAVGGMAAGIHFGVFDFMTDLFGQSSVLPQAQDMVVADLTSVALDHSVLAVEEAVYDGGNLRLVYSVRSTDETLSIEEAAKADQVSLYGCDWFYINGDEIVMTNGSSFGSVLAPEGDKLLCYLDIYMASSGIVPEGDFTVSLPLIGKEAVSFTVPGYQVAMNPAVTETDSVKVTLLSTSLSPIRAYARLRIEKQPDASIESYEAALGDWRDAYLVDAEGSKLSAPTEILTDASEEGKWIELTYTFLPVENEKVFFAPTIITAENEWIVDMAHALPMQ